MNFFLVFHRFLSLNGKSFLLHSLPTNRSFLCQSQNVLNEKHLVKIFGRCCNNFFPLQRIRCLSSLVPSANLGCLPAAFVGVVVEDLGHKIQVIEETQFIIWSSNRQKVALEFFVLSIGQVFQKPFAAFKSLLSRNRKV